MLDNWFKRLEEKGELVASICSCGWAWWPRGAEGGFMDSRGLRALADELDQRNKPFWDEYERYCAEQEESQELLAAGTPLGESLGFDFPPIPTEENVKRTSMNMPPKINEFDYLLLTGAWEGPGGAAKNECWEFCVESGLMNKDGVPTDLGLRAIHRYQSAKAGRIDVI